MRVESGKYETRQKIKALHNLRDEGGTAFRATVSRSGGKRPVGRPQA